MYRQKTTCRACGEGNLEEVFNLGVQPLANDFCTADQESAGHAPLKVMLCPSCTNAQLSVVVDPNIIYRNYPYVTSKSETMRGHFKNLWDEICKECEPKTMVEIGSNDGLFVEFCHARGVKSVIGVDPAANLQPKQGPDGVEYICSLFDEYAIRQISAKRPVIDLVVARHVFCHIDDWRKFIQNIEDISNTNTLVVIEVPYVKDMLLGFEFDTIYHEHLDYVSVKAMQALLKESIFKLHKVVRFEIHGGAIVMMLRRGDLEMRPHPSVINFEVLESLDSSAWKKFREGSQLRINLLRDLIARTADSVSICGFGASAKSTVWINACGFTNKDIDFICDCTPEKQGKFSPGSLIPIVPESELLAKQPEMAMLFAWNFKEEIMKKNFDYVSRGGRWIIPGADQTPRVGG